MQPICNALDDLGAVLMLFAFMFMAMILIMDAT